jgi:antitoxin YefM
MRITPLVNAQIHLAELVESVHLTHQRVTITRDGQTDAVLISPEELESLEETIAVLSDSEAMAEIAEARAAIAQGETVRASAVHLPTAH